MSTNVLSHMTISRNVQILKKQIIKSEIEEKNHMKPNRFLFPFIQA